MVRESCFAPNFDIVAIRTSSINQREVVIEFTRSVMIFRSGAPEIQDVFPETEAGWSIQDRFVRIEPGAQDMMACAAVAIASTEGMISSSSGGL
jgi:hypothetical protein